jgi:hypothetical protein
VAKSYKALAGNQAKLAIQVLPVKEAISIGISQEDADAAVSAAVRSILVAGDWIAVDGHHFIKIDLSLPTGTSKQFCVSLSVSTSIYQPRRLHVGCSIRKTLGLHLDPKDSLMTSMCFHVCFVH